MIEEGTERQTERAKESATGKESDIEKDRQAEGERDYDNYNAKTISRFLRKTFNVRNAKPKLLSTYPIRGREVQKCTESISL